MHKGYKMTKINKIKINKPWNNGEIEAIKAELMDASKGKEKAEWEKRIVNTSYPCIAVPSTVIDNIAKRIAKNNYVGFLDLWHADNYSELVLEGKVISRIKDRDEFVKYLNQYLDRVDSWGATDILKYPINGNEQYFWGLSGEYLLSTKPYVRRCGLLIMMKGFVDGGYIDQVLERVDNMSEESEYYVQMMLAWLLSECYIKCRDKTLQYYKQNRQSAWVINKSISKCRDSYRVTQADKKMLLQFKK